MRYRFLRPRSETLPRRYTSRYQCSPKRYKTIILHKSTFWSSQNTGGIDVAEINSAKNSINQKTLNHVYHLIRFHYGNQQSESEQIFQPQYQMNPCIRRLSLRLYISYVNLTLHTLLSALGRTFVTLARRYVTLAYRISDKSIFWKLVLCVIFIE